MVNRSIEIERVILGGSGALKKFVSAKKNLT